ncbi:MAG TPA: PLP-dependent aminotransferase family protein [Steroidobacteraceae bacterium]|nr:PLP-dependent aminotransferase family protein [Steroidobacteraceae bacterium]
MNKEGTSSGRKASAPELLLRVDRDASEPLRAQLEQELRAAIRAGRLEAGAPLPSTRALAADLGLSRGIVVDAYEQLLAEGYLIARQGSATSVAEGRVITERAEPQRSAKPAPQSAAVPIRYDFRPAVPDTSTFPRRAWHKSLRKVLATAAAGTMGYPDPLGTSAARSALSAYTNRARGTSAHPDRMLVCNGFTQGFRLTCTVLRRLGIEAVATEDPSHEEQREAVRDAGLKCVPVPVDEDGLIVERLEKSAARAVLVTPAHQYPTGAVMSPERRAALLDWATRKQAFIIEDDYDAEFRYDREPIGALQGIAPERVVYIGSASKTLAPALRLGWVVTPEGLVEEFARVKKREDRGSASLEQLAFADFIERGELDRHLRRMRRIYRGRRDTLVTALRNHLPKRRVFGIAAGLHLMLELPSGADESEVVAAARKLSVNVTGTQEYRGRTRLPPSLILGYGVLRDSAVAEGVRRLASVVERR